MLNKNICTTIAWFSSILMLAIIPLFASYTLGAEPTGQDKIKVKATDTDQLKTLLFGKNVELMFQDGTYVKGKVKQVYDGEVLIAVKDSEGPSALRKGERKVATNIVSTIQNTYRKGPYRALLAGGLAAGAFIPVSKSNLELDSALQLGLTTVPVGALAGYLVGRSVDKKTRTIIIMP